MLKPIPQERPSHRANNKKNGNKAHIMRLEMKIRSMENVDTRLFSVVSKKLTEYVKNGENISLKELGELIHNLQRSVIGLQKKRINIVRRQQRKKKRGT